KTTAGLFLQFLEVGLQEFAFGPA
ncbi:MAG: hypothetical protein JWN34_1612, partial [Bryobacterales bacterium]|nr:hypothetical protein [Bryobacterales bacterium]